MSAGNASAAPLVLYIQLPLGPAHLARIRALDAVDGIRCRGVQLASLERTRRDRIEGEPPAPFTTLTEGEYESLSRRHVLSRAAGFVKESGARAIIVDAPADPVQLLMGRIAQRRGVLACTRWAATWADHPRHTWKEYMKRLVYRGWDAYFATGSRSIEYLETFGVPKRRVFKCGNPVDADAIAAAKAAAPLAPRERSFLFVGRFLRLKNLERFAEAYLRYRAEGGTWTLDLVGFGESEAAVRAALQHQSGVTFHGHLGHDRLIPMYLRAGCLVLPSYSENWGLVVNEAMHAGMPIAVSGVTGCVPELLEESGNGISFDPLDIGAMTRALHEIEGMDKLTRVAMGRRSLEIIQPHSQQAWAECVAAGLSQCGLGE